MPFSFNFQNKDSYIDMLIEIEGDRPSNALPQRDVDFIDVQGRTGSLSIDYGTYRDIILQWKGFLRNQSNIQEQFGKIKAWLSSGWGDLWFSDEPDKKYEAICINQIDFIQSYVTFGEFPIIFRCKPYKESTFKDNFTITKNPYTICNPGTLESPPRLDIYGTGNISITVNGNTFSIYDLTDYVTVDSELMDCYRDNELRNSEMQGDFPVFQPGDNIISWNGNISKIEVTPNWRWI